MLAGCIGRLFALPLRAKLENTVSLLVALEAQSLLFVSLTLLKS
jgi:hypothetical protein